jgi:hypothetical protein
MSDRALQINGTGPESVMISKEERYELIALVARALEERRRSSREELDYGWDEDAGVNFSSEALNFS